MISNDCVRVESSILYLPFLIVVPAEVTFATFMLYNCVDRSVLSGLLVIFLAIPLQTILAKIYNHMRLLIFFLPHRATAIICLYHAAELFFQQANHLQKMR